MALAGKSAYVQLWQAPAWRARADRQHTTSQELPAPRGPILDAEGTVLVESRPLVRMAVAPREVRQDARARLAVELERAGVAKATVNRALDTARAWVPIAGHYLSAEVSTLSQIRGVHFEPVLERVPSPLAGLRGLVGHAAADGGGLDGIELALDSLLRGVPGRAESMRDGRGRRLLSPQMERVFPRTGHTVVLTLRLDLQDIAERALADAVMKTGARGGDVILLDPRSGELLALASRRSDPRASTATALTEPVEPGSTLKPFVAAIAMDLGRVQLDDVFETYNGVYTHFGRRLTDVHKAPRMTFAEVMQYSSNIGMAQLAHRLTKQEEYEGLRDFGFGMATGLPFPSEANGVLRGPGGWSLQTQASLARGYEIMVTPVQLAVAYGAIANGGELLQPALVKEIRDPEGRIVYRHKRTVVRRAMSAGVASTMRNLLKSVVESGTATRADLSTYEVGGKSGTAKRTVAGRYTAGEYTATFVGLFPAEDPQLVVLVKIDSPGPGAYYGGQIAAPVTKVVLEAALASRDAALDRPRLERGRVAVAPGAVTEPVMKSSDQELPGRIASDGTVPVVLNVLHERQGMVPVAGPRNVPEVRGLSVRAAVAALHRAGFRVRTVRGGSEGVTVPAAGTPASPGTLVQLQSGT